ncbi:MAG: HEPN domain-containing protein [bacterium]
MTNTELMRSYLENAKIKMRLARDLLKEGIYHTCVEFCQESIELSLKALLINFGIDFPKEHNLGRIIDNALVSKQIALDDRRRIRRISGSLQKKRLLSFYGDDEGRPPDSLFGRDDALQSIDDAEYVMGIVLGVV